MSWIDPREQEYREKQYGWDVFHLFMAHNYATKSKDPSTKAGCVVVDKNNVPVGWGFNGLSRNHDSEKEDMILADRSKKYPRVIHAELNAEVNSTGSFEGTTAYITHPPCLGCLNVLSHKGVKRFVSIEPTESFASRWDEEETKQEAIDLKVDLVLYTRNMMKKEFLSLSQTMLDFL